MQTITIGPWIFAFGLAALVLGYVAASLVAWFMRRRGAADAGTPLLVLLVAALVAARIAWIAEWWSAYRAAPWSMLDIRDGGFVWWAGLAVLVVGALAWCGRRPRLRRALSASAVAGILVWGLVSLAGWQLRGVAPRSDLPTVTLHTLDGQPTTLAALRGKPLVVNVWATWCGPCRAEMPMLVAASHRLHDVRFVFVDHGEPAATVRHYLAESGMDPRTVLLDQDGALMQLYNLPGCPDTLFFNASGQLRQLRVGSLSAGTLSASLARIVPGTGSLARSDAASATAPGAGAPADQVAM